MEACVGKHAGPLSGANEADDKTAGDIGSMRRPSIRPHAQMRNSSTCRGSTSRGCTKENTSPIQMTLTQLLNPCNHRPLQRLKPGILPRTARPRNLLTSCAHAHEPKYMLQAEHE